MKESHSVADPDSKPRRLPKGSYMLGSRPPNCDILFSQTDRHLAPLDERPSFLT
jgi:hypothetical protein